VEKESLTRKMRIVLRLMARGLMKFLEQHHSPTHDAIIEELNELHEKRGRKRRTFSSGWDIAAELQKNIGGFVL
jgi:hypothetical protein